MTNTLFMNRPRPWHAAAPALLLGMVLWGVAHAEPHVMTVEEAHAWLEDHGDRVFVLDVRTPREHGQGMIAGTDALANWYRWDHDWPRVEPAVDKSTPILVYCAVGGRSDPAAEWLREQGYEDVRHVGGGFQGWQAAGFAVQRPDN